MKGKESVKLMDVAKLAKVSPATVSRVLNGIVKVDEEKQKRVNDAVIKLGYRPSRVAQRLRSQSRHSLLIGLIIPDLQNPFFSDIARGVEDITQQENHAVVICNSDENAEKEAFYVNTLRSEYMGGLIVAPTPGNKDLIQEMVNEGFPVLYIDRIIASVKTDSITVNSELGGYMATRHLIELGHERIGVIGGNPNLETSQKRVEGYHRALREANISSKKSMILWGDSKRNSGRRCAQAFLNRKQRPTAIFSTNNLMTLGTLQAVNESGLRIPEDISVIGFDDIPWATALNPPLTAIKQPSYEMGRRAAELLLARIKGKNESVRQEIITPSLVVRQSTGSV